MTANVCGRERRTRGILGVILIIVGFIVSETLGWVIGIVGAGLLLTAMFSYCPINAISHRNTCTRPLVRDPSLRDRMREDLNL